MHFLKITFLTKKTEGAVSRSVSKLLEFLLPGKSIFFFIITRVVVGSDQILLGQAQFSVAVNAVPNKL